MVIYPILTIRQAFLVSSKKVTEKIVGPISTGHLTTISVKSAKVAIKMVIISNYFGKNVWCTFTQMLNEKKM